MEEQSQVEELQKNLQEQGSKADDVSKCLYSCTHTALCVIPAPVYWLCFYWRLKVMESHVQ